VLALWAEMNLALADEFRDGNAPAHTARLPVAQRAVQALPDTVNEYYFQGDAAPRERELVSWLREEQRRVGQQGFIGFGISLRMAHALKEHMARVPERV